MCISERLRQVCEAKNWKIKDFAEQTGIAYRTLQGYVGGEREPNAEGMTAIAKAGVNLNWLVSGEGEMFVQHTRKMECLTKEELSLLEKYQKCNQIGKKAIELNSIAISNNEMFNQ
ncbi:helix-turn-helix domain-containing protein [Glaesserella parasuis]|nr:helix-turn-helix domain-containing protein [Glaesserella parasuis]